MSKAISRCMGNIHIIDESDTLLLMPCGTVWVIIVDWNLSGVICHGYWQFAARIICSQQDICHSLRSRFRRLQASMTASRYWSAVSLEIGLPSKWMPIKAFHTPMQL